MTDIVRRLRFMAVHGGQKDAIEAMNDAANEIERLRAALQSIAQNTCCDRCQEAALVARRALEPKP